MIHRQHIPALLLLALSLVSCKADKAGGGPGSGGEKDDAGVGDILAPPTLEDVPETTPRNTIALRGTSTGDRVVVQGGPDGTALTSILPGGNFCTDVQLVTGEPTELTIYAMGDGLLSTSTHLTVTKDDLAPDPPNPTCSGMNEPVCAAAEVCGNDIDDDCNGYVGNCDISCSGCVDDALEPNDFAVNVPIIASGQHELQLCPCREDWFAFNVKVGDHIEATADFQHSVMDLDMRIYKTLPNGEQGDPVVGSFSSTDQEHVDFTVAEDGLYYLRVYIFGADKKPDAQGPYRLTIP